MATQLTAPSWSYSSNTVPSSALSIGHEDPPGECLQCAVAEDCEFYNYCGNNEICVRGEQAKVKCQCLPGFIYAARGDGVGSSESAPPGCVRSTPLLAQQRNDTSNSSTTASSASPSVDLSKPDGLYLLKSMKLPDTAAMNTTTTNEGNYCATCLQDDSCTACLYLHGCYTWSGDLVDMFQFTVGSDNEDLSTKGTYKDSARRPP